MPSISYYFKSYWQYGKNSQLPISQVNGLVCFLQRFLENSIANFLPYMPKYMLLSINICTEHLDSTRETGKWKWTIKRCKKVGFQNFKKEKKKFSCFSRLSHFLYLPKKKNWSTGGEIKINRKTILSLTYYSYLSTISCLLLKTLTKKKKKKPRRYYKKTGRFLVVELCPIWRNSLAYN